jgi:hypothetical protein
MDEVRTRAFANGATQRGRVGEELVAQSGEQRVDVRCVERRDHIDVERGPGLTAECAGKRTAHRVSNTAGLQRRRGQKSDADGIGHDLPGGAAGWNVG